MKKIIIIFCLFIFIPFAKLQTKELKVCVGCFKVISPDSDYIVVQKEIPRTSECCSSSSYVPEKAVHIGHYAAYKKCHAIWTKRARRECFENIKLIPSF